MLIIVQTMMTRKIIINDNDKKKKINTDIKLNNKASISQQQKDIAFINKTQQNQQEKQRKNKPSTNINKVPSPTTNLIPPEYST